MSRADDPRSGRLPPEGDAGCILRRTRTVTVAGEAELLVAVWVSRRRDCGGPNSVMLSLWRPHAQAGRELVARVGGTDAAFGGPEPLEFKTDCRFCLFGDPANAAQAEQLLSDILTAEALPASALPSWPADAPSPSVPPKLNLHPGTGRATYEAIRRLGVTTLCWMPTTDQVTCVASAPAREPRQTRLFTIDGLDREKASTARAAIARLSN